MSNTSTRDSLLAAITAAQDLNTQMAAVAALADFDRNQVQAAQTARDVDWADTTIRQTLSPVAVHERSTVATDWLAEFEPKAAGLNQHTAMAEAAMWFSRVSPEVKADREEFAIQAQGFMRREASRYGEEMENVYQAGLSYLAVLHRQAASGLPQVQQLVDSFENPAQTPLNPETFDNFADEVHPINAGVVGTETSERAPLINLIEQEGQGQGQPEKPGGHSVTNEPTGPTPPYSGTDMGSGPLNTQSVAINHVMNLDEFRRQAASGLPQVEQVVDSFENPAPTPLPEEVAFPWLIDGQNPDEDEKKEASRAPFGRKADLGKQAATHVMMEDDTDPDTGVTVPKGARVNVSGYTKAGDDADGKDWAHVRHNGQDLMIAPHKLRSLTQASSQFGGLSEAEYQRYTDLNTKVGPLTDAEKAERDSLHGRSDAGKQASRKQADMFGNSDMPHAVPGRSPANDPTTNPDLNSGYQDGVQDALTGDRPTFADASSSVRENVKDYSEGYSDALNGRPEQPKNVPFSMGGDNGQGTGQAKPDISMGASLRSVAFVEQSERKHSDFTKGYGFAAKWNPSKPLVTLGSAQFEAGLYAGLVDAHGIGSDTDKAWVAAHRKQASKDPSFRARMDAQNDYTAHLRENGINVAAATSSELDTMSPAASPAPTGETPINGPGTRPPLDDGLDPARPGGPAPYNAAEPLGAPVVPSGVHPDPAPGADLVNDAIGGPLDQNNKAMAPLDDTNKAMAFRQRVQASLANRNEKGDS